MKEVETVKKFANILSKMVTQTRSLGEELNDQRIVEKLFVSFPDRFETKNPLLKGIKIFLKYQI
uniref:Uncharacterized protein n=1 Tax=Cajanus cajan TaxID=3821 RepID=A0A151S431_CAJCA|nr:hypothetical protein KK1_028720 [Cajanus cajan]